MEKIKKTPGKAHIKKIWLGNRMCNVKELNGPVSTITNVGLSEKKLLDNQLTNANDYIAGFLI